MSNSNYDRGVRFERKVKAELEARGYTVLRTAGSHGFADLVALKGHQQPVLFVQCKCLKAGTKKQAARLVRAFLANPPMPVNEHFEQSIEVYAMKDKTRATGAI